MKSVYLLLLSVLLCGCSIDTAEFKMPVTTNEFIEEKPTSDIRTVINEFRQADSDLFTFDSETLLTVNAYVVSSDESGNFYKTLVIQDRPENPTMGMVLKIDLRAYFSKYNVGRKIQIRLSGLSMKGKNGKYTVGYLSGNRLVDIPESLLDHYIMRTPEIVDIVPQSISLEMVSTGLINTFVVIDRVQFLKTDQDRSFASEAYDKFNGERLIEQCNNLAKSYLFTSTYADFRANPLPDGRVQLNAILTIDDYSEEVILVLNNPNDLVVIDQERCDPDFFECPINLSPIGNDVIFYEDFEDLSYTRDIEKIGWKNINVNFGNGRFKKRSSNENTFLQISAYNSNEYVMEVWLVSPEIELDHSEKEYLSFETRATFEEGSLLTCWFSSDYRGNVRDANWQQLDLEFSVGTFDGSNEAYLNSGAVQLECLEGTIRVAFRYLGSDPGASTTYDLDNILILGNKNSN